MHGRVATALVIAAFVLGAGCGGSDDSDTSTQAAAPVTCPDPAGNPANPFDANELIGMTVEEATSIAQTHDCTVRVTERDGDPLPATMELQGNRIDVTVTNGKITAVSQS